LLLLLLRMLLRWFLVRVDPPHLAPPLTPPFFLTPSITFIPTVPQSSSSSPSCPVAPTHSSASITVLLAHFLVTAFLPVLRLARLPAIHHGFAPRAQLQCDAARRPRDAAVGTFACTGNRGGG